MLLKPKYKEILLDIFAEFQIPFEIWAYGSRINGGAHDGSDLDLVIVAPEREKIPLDILMALKEKIRESKIPILVDIFDWSRLPESFRKNIEESHELFFQSTQIILNEPDAKYNATIAKKS